MDLTADPAAVDLFIVDAVKIMRRETHREESDTYIDINVLSKVPMDTFVLVRVLRRVLFVIVLRKTGNKR